MNTHAIPATKSTNESMFVLSQGWCTCHPVGRPLTKALRSPLPMKLNFKAPWQVYLAGLLCWCEHLPHAAGQWMHK